MPDPFSELQKRAGGKLFIAAEPDLLFWLIFHKHGCLTEAYVNISIEKLKKQEGDFFFILYSIMFLSSGWWTLQKYCGVHNLQAALEEVEQHCLYTHTHTQCKHTQYKEREWSISRFRLKKNPLQPKNELWQTIYINYIPISCSPTGR